MKKWFSLALSLCMLLTSLAGLAIAEEEITLKVVFQENGDTTHYADMGYWDWIYEKTGVRCEVELVSHDALTLRLAAGDYPDVSTQYGSAGASAIQAAAEAGAVWELTDERLAEYAPTWKAYFDNNPSYKALLVDKEGKLWSLPNGTAMPAVGEYNADVPLYNKHILEVTGCEIPTTTEEFRTFLQKAKAAIEAGELPANTKLFTFNKMRGNRLAGTEAFIYSYFGAIVARDANRIDDMLYLTDGVTVSSNFYDKKEELKEAFRFLSSLYQEGLIGDDVFTTTHNDYYLEMSSDAPQAVYALAQDTEGYATGYPLTSGMAESYLGVGISGSYGNYTHTYTIYESCEHPEAALRVAEAMVDSTESLIYTRYGRVGENFWVQSYDPETETYTRDYSKNSNEWAVADVTPKYYICNTMDSAWLLQHDATPITEGSRDWIVTEWLDQNPSFKSTEDGYSYFAEPPASCYEEGEVELVTQYRADFASLWENKSANWIMDASNIDVEMDEMIAELEAMGYQDYMEIQQRALDVFNSRK